MLRAAIVPVLRSAAEPGVPVRGALRAENSVEEITVFTYDHPEFLRVGALVRTPGIQGALLRVDGSRKRFNDVGDQRLGLRSSVMRGIEELELHLAPPVLVTVNYAIVPQSRVRFRPRPPPQSGVPS